MAEILREGWKWTRAKLTGEAILSCGFAEQKLQERLGANSLTVAKRKIQFYRTRSGDRLAQKIRKELLEWEEFSIKNYNLFNFNRLLTI